MVAVGLRVSRVLLLPRHAWQRAPHAAPAASAAAARSPTGPWLPGARREPVGLSRLAASGPADHTPLPASSPPEYFYKMSEFCRRCGGPMDVGLEDTTWRHICSGCGYIDYFNPKMVVGCVIEHEGKVLLCRRGIEPCKGKWTLPAGFMELHESTAEGARRETREEVMAEVAIQAPYFHIDIPVIGQSYVLFRSTLAAPFTFAAGPETLEVALFEPKDIPFDDLAFSSITITLQHFVEDMQAGSFRLHHAEIEKIPGTAPNDPNSFRLINHMAFQVAP